jgi:hypothetical protein
MMSKLDFKLISSKYRLSFDDVLQLAIAYSLLAQLSRHSADLDMR